MIIQQQLQIQKKIRNKNKITNSFAFRIIGWDLFWGADGMASLSSIENHSEQQLLPVYDSHFYVANMSLQFL